MAQLDILVTGIQKGIDKYYNEFYELTHQQAYSIALQMMKKEEDALDVLQDAYIKAYQKIESLENPEKLFSWFNMIVANTCRDYLKRKTPVLFNEIDTDEFEFQDTLENEKQEFIPEATIDYNETKRLMKEILDHLSPEQKLCTLLYYYDELTVKEIAEALECSENTVKSRLNYARKKIKEDVLELEKKGTKLYGIAPIPFIIWMLKQEALAIQVPNIGAAVSVGVGTAAVTGTAETIGHIAAEETVRETAGHSLLESIGTFFAKLFTPKAVAVTVAAAVAVGGGVGGKAIYDNYQEEQELARQAAAEDAILAEIDEEFLKNLFYYAPCFDEEHPVSDEEMYCLMQHSIVYKYMNYFEELSLPTPIKESDVIEAVESEALESKDYMLIKIDTFDEIFRRIGFFASITDDYFATVYPYSHRLMYEEGGIYWENPGLNGGTTDWDLSIDYKVRDNGKIKIHYTLTETDYTQAYIGIEIFSSFRTATLELTNNGYIITSIVESSESTGGRSIVETILDYPRYFGTETLSVYDRNFDDIFLLGEKTGTGLQVYFEEDEIQMNIVGSNDYITLIPVSNIDGVLTYELKESSRPSGGAELASMTLIYDYMNSTVEIKDAGEEFDDMYIVQ